VTAGETEVTPAVNGRPASRSSSPPWTRAYVLQVDDPGDALRMLDRKIQHFEPDAMATVQYAVYQQDAGQLTIWPAGHLPPEVAVPGEEPRLAEFDTDLPVGAGEDRPRRSSVIGLPPGSLLCFYTDGLVERRGEVLDTGIDLASGLLG
jgi:serine phosphatase RsbU (regulator of sigma subunit)